MTVAGERDAESAWGVPRWTERLFAPSGGLDHLGLASVIQDRILPSLSPGVNVLTFHPRYWSFYAFVATEFWDRELPRTASAFNAFLRGRESIFATSCLLCPEHGIDIPQVIGFRRLSRDVYAEAAYFDPNVDYLKNRRGGYAVYASAIADLGLIVLAASSPQLRCDAPTEEGRAVAERFRSAIADTDYYREYLDSDELVPAGAVLEYGTAACLCQLPTGPERGLLVDAFCHGGDPIAAEARRASLRFICDVADQTRAESVSQGDFRRIIYFRSDEGSSYTPSSGVETTARRWRLYQLREYFNFALNRLLQRTIAWGLAHEGDIVPIPLGEVIAQADTADFVGLADALGADAVDLTPSRPFADLLDWVRGEANVSGDLDDPWEMEAAIQEDALFQWAASAGEDDRVVAAMLTLVALLASRLWRRELELTYANDWDLIRAGGTRRVGLDGFLRALRTRVSDGATIAEVGRWILEQHVCRLHNRVAMTKLPDDTFRLRLDAGNVRFFNQDAPAVMSDSRFVALATCVAELGWTTSIFEADHSLGEEGRRLVKDGDLVVTDGPDR